VSERRDGEVVDGLEAREDHGRVEEKKNPRQRGEGAEPKGKERPCARRIRGV